MHIAHIRSTDHSIQTVQNHLIEVKQISEKIGLKINVQHLTGLAGMMHDVGKYNPAFTDYIKRAVLEGDTTQLNKIDHSTAGAKILYDRYHKTKISPYYSLMAEIVGNAVMSHHSYLRDYLSPNLEQKFMGRVEKKLDAYELIQQAFTEEIMSYTELDAYVDKAVQELKNYVQSSGEALAQKMFFLTKYIFSALIDADRTNTRDFESGVVQREVSDLNFRFERYYKLLMLELQRKNEFVKSSEVIHKWRNKLSENCEEWATKPSDIYTLSMPTGSGKTLASLRFALKHSVTYDKKRIIYILPYTTIIEQNAQEVRNIIDDELGVLEHHSNVVRDEENDNSNEEYKEGQVDAAEKLKLAQENWDAPIIFTTMVQFLNVFYAKSNRYTRRLHQLTDAVVIFDEVQKVPTHCITLFNQALNFMKSHCKSTILLCTATQPALDYVDKGLHVSSESEVIRNLSEVNEVFKRVRLHDLATKETLNTESLHDLITEKLDQASQILVILNTKTVVKRLYQQLIQTYKTLNDVHIFHLSTSMCAEHRKEKLEEMKSKLVVKKKVICISTPLIEAGVDISFPVVIRSLAGLDSIAQTAGRCNRHGDDIQGNVYLIKHSEEKLDKLVEVKTGGEITYQLLVDITRDPLLFGGDVLSNKAMRFYFERFYSIFQNKLNYLIPKLSTGLTMSNLLFANRGDSILKKEYEKKTGINLSTALANSYQTAAENFEVIEQMAYTVLVHYDKSESFIAELMGENSIEQYKILLKKIQPYCVQLFKHEILSLEKNDGIYTDLSKSIFILREGFYSEEYGVDLEGNQNMNNYIL